MFVYIKNFRRKLIGFVAVILIIAAITLMNIIIFRKTSIMLGAFIHVQRDHNYESSEEYDSDKYYESNERFNRSSKLPALKLKYEFIRPKDADKVPPYIAEGFPAIYKSSEDVIHAYYAILKEAANMKGYFGGCGTILWMDEPYPYAYRLLSDSIKKKISLEEFKNSFKGIGAMNLLHLTPAYQPPNTPKNIKYYFVEIEVLKGHKYRKGKEFKIQPNYFEYYYGIVTTIYNEKEGWKIKSIDYLPEIYLCHPLHGWDYDYDAIIGVIYNNWYKMNLTIDHVEVKNNNIQVYANNKDNLYKFDFIRLTNGDDVLLHEYIKENDRWKEVSILKPDDEKYYKISILKFNNE